MAGVGCAELVGIFAPELSPLAGLLCIALETPTLRNSSVATRARAFVAEVRARLGG